MRFRSGRAFKDWVAKNVPDDALVVVPGDDHSYREANVHVTTALVGKRGHITEDYGEKSTPEAEYGKRTNVVVVT
jgi:hypothetical protein